MIRIVALAGLIALAGCGSGREPLVDRIGVSDARYNRDLAECRASGSLFSLSNPVADCLKGKGYKVLMGNSGL